MKKRSFREWVEFYERHAGEEFRPVPAARLLFDPEFGFMEIREDVEGSRIIVGATAGDGDYWWRMAEEAARARGYGKIVTFSRRDPRALLRRFKGATMIGAFYEMEVV